MPTAPVKQTVLDAANLGIRMLSVDDEVYELMAVLTSMYGQELSLHVQPGEIAAMCVPVRFSFESTMCPGVAMFIEKRVVLVWGEGEVDDLEISSLSYAIEDITDVERYTLAADSGEEFDAVSFTADGDPFVILAPAINIKDNFGFIMVSTLIGAMTFDTSTTQPGAEGSQGGRPSGFVVLAVRSVGDEPTDFYPTPLPEADCVEGEVEDGGDVSTAVATAITISRDVGGVGQKLAVVDGTQASVIATGCRLTIACSKYVVGRGGWFGIGWGGLAVAATMNVAAKVIAARHRRGQMLVGHVRYPWLDAVMFQPASTGVKPAVRLVVLDPFDGEPLFVEMELDRSADAEAFATDIAVLAAVHLLETPPALPDDVAAYLDELVKERRPVLSVGGYWAGFALEPDSRWFQ